MLSNNPQIFQVAEYLKSATKVLITAGAGMGVDSGMPDFRGKEGFWKIFKPFSMKFTFQDCANPAFLHSHPYHFWGFYAYRLEMYRNLSPHQGFAHLLGVCKMPNIKDSFVVTSNVDGHFQKAGFDENKVYEIHGSIHYMQCSSCNTIFSADKYQPAYDPTSFEAKDPLPACDSCKKILRPNILMFGDYEFDDSRCHKQSVVFQDFVNNLKEKDSLVILEFGAGHAVPTIRYLGEQLLHSRKCDTKLIRVNLRDFDAPVYSSSFSKSKLKDFMAFSDTALNFTNELHKCLKD